MVKDDEGWTPPQRKPITKEVLDRAIGAEEDAASQEHQAREAWFDGQHGTATRAFELAYGRDVKCHSTAGTGCLEWKRIGGRSRNRGRRVVCDQLG